jgi:cytochrome c oxidase subunit 2
VIAIAVVSAIVLAKNGHAGASPLRVNVTGQQFAWSFSYPAQGGITSGTLRLPVGRSVKLYLRSRETDVIHSFWVPEFSQKQDLLPGMTTTVVITPDRVGTYPVICTELCGLGHSVMRTKAIVMPAQAFTAWAQKQQKAAKSGGKQGGKATFAANGCASCHTFKPAGATAKVGPDLDKLPQYAKQAGQPLDKFVRESIVSPKAYVQPGYQALMPSFASLPSSQLDALVQYLVGGSKKGGS